MPGGETTTHPFSIAEYKADFDRALDDLGRGHWSGDNISPLFKSYRGFGRLQRIVIADIIGVEDSELEAMGFYSIPRLRGLAYWRMKQFLNGGDMSWLPLLARL